jgi:glycosyltransferase involved in cell wall biosynthesis
VPGVGVFVDMKITVVVPTRNRAQMLQHLLHALSGLQCPPSLEWEAWIVDNDSNDTTRAVVESYQRAEPLRFHYLHEVAKGKSRALNQGIRHATGEVVAFTDDDCIPCPQWIELIAREFSSRSELSVLGGRVELGDPDHEPVAVRTGREHRVLTSASDVSSFIIGGNMAVRYEVFQAIGQFDVDNCPGSPHDTAWEDADFVYRAFKHGFRVEYHPDLLVHHYGGRRRGTDLSLVQRTYMRGRGSFYAKHTMDGDLVVFKLAYWDIRSLVLGILKNLATGKPVRAKCRLLWFLLGGAATRFSQLRSWY